MDYIIDNWELIATALLGLHAAVRVAVVMTPTKKDDEVLATAAGKWRKLLVILSKLLGLSTQQGRKR
jgi:hypothetical protein